MGGRTSSGRSSWSMSGAKAPSLATSRSPRDSRGTSVLPEADASWNSFSATARR